jgi:serine protease Do
MNPNLHPSMKLKLVLFSAACFAATAFPAERVETRREVIVDTPSAPRVLHVKDTEAVEKETVTYLGIETSPVGSTLTRQLNLPREVGLVVNVVVPESPAVGALEPHDILLRFDDQLLIVPPQLRVLVRAKKSGDEVTLTLVRGGKEQTVKVKLGQHEVPKMTLMHGFGQGDPVWFGQDPQGLRLQFGRAQGMPREEADRVLRIIRHDPLPSQQAAIPHAERIIEERGGQLPRATVINVGRSSFIYRYDDGTLELNIMDGKKDLIAKSQEGKVVFSGPINTEEERKAVPANVLTRLKDIETPGALDYVTGDEFEAPVASPDPGEGAQVQAAGTPAVMIPCGLPLMIG